MAPYRAPLFASLQPTYEGRYTQGLTIKLMNLRAQTQTIQVLSCLEKFCFRSYIFLVWR